jgi:hypothetical protein
MTRDHKPVDLARRIASDKHQAAEIERLDKAPDILKKPPAPSVKVRMRKAEKQALGASRCNDAYLGQSGPPAGLPRALPPDPGRSVPNGA